MKESNRQQLQGVAAVLLSATCFAATSVLIKTAYKYHLGPFEILTLQSWFASVLLLFYAFFFDRSIFKISRRTLFIIAFQGIVGSLGTSILYANALLYLPVSVAILLLYLYPVLVLGAGVIFLNKKAGRQELLALALTLAGTSVASGITSGVGAVSLTGIVLGLASAVAYAVFNVVGELALQEISPLAAMSFAQWFSSLGLLVYLQGEIIKIPWQNPQVWGIGFALATIASIFPFYLILLGIKLIGSDKAAILSTFELPVTFLMAAFFLHEIPNLAQLTGGVLVFAGIIILNWRSNHETQRTK